MNGSPQRRPELPTQASRLISGKARTVADAVRRNATVAPQIAGRERLPVIHHPSRHGVYGGGEMPRPVSARPETRYGPTDRPRPATTKAQESRSRHDRSGPPRCRAAPACCRHVARAQSVPRAVRGADAVRAQRGEDERRDPDWPERARGPPPAAAGRAIVSLDWVKAFDLSAGGQFVASGAKFF